MDISVPQAVQVDTITLESHLKRADATDPQGFADVTIENYVVTYRRTDGGTIVPPPQTFGGGPLVPSGGTATLTNFPIMYASAVQGTPFDQLLPFNGGVDRQTGKTEIDTAFDITFFGHTASGNAGPERDRQRNPDLSLRERRLAPESRRRLLCAGLPSQRRFSRWSRT